MATANAEFFTEAQPSQLSLFDLPPTQTAVERIYFQEVRPISQLSGTSPVDFSVSGQNGMEYVDLKRSLLCVKANITNADGTDILKTGSVGPINLFLQSLFTQVDVTLQGKLVTASTGHYSYKAMVQTLLGYGVDAKTSQLTTQLWEKDTTGHMDDANAITGLNSGLFKRAQYFTESKTVDMIGPIFHDLFKLNRYILNQVGITIKFYRSKPQFSLMSSEVDADFRINIQDMVLKICKVQINPAVIYAHSQALLKTNAKYTFTKTEVKMMAIPQGQVNFTWDNIFQGIRPNRVVVGFINSQAVAGGYTLSPWNFQGYDLNQISVSVDGIPAENNIMKLNYDSKNCSTTVDVLVSMFQTTRKWMNDTGNHINRDDIGGGFALYSFDLEPAFEEGQYLTLNRQGNVRLDAQFGKALPHPVSCLIYSENNGFFQLTLARDVLLE